jgi:lipid-A-disaccharide synthase
MFRQVACYNPPRLPDEILIVAAEASADLHAARALEEFTRLRPGARAFGVGGPRLRAAGLEALYPAEDLNVMGFAEVLPKIPRILAVLRGLRRAAEERRPRVALLVDSPDFNLRLARHLKRLGVKVVYYVSPMIWAWRRGRARKIARVVDRMLCILPFEERFYEGTGVSARFVGHPFAERALPGDVASYRTALGLPSGRTTVALLPGSRRSEIARILPPMLEAAERIRALHPDVQFVIPVALTLSEESLRPALARHSGLDVRLVAGRADESVGASDAVLVKSGTSTLETALMNRPMVVVYKMAWLSYWVARLLVRMSHFALVNILAGRTVVPELLQQEASPARMAAEIERLLSDPGARRAQLDGLAEVRRSLGEPGAARRVAEEIAGALP